MALLDALEGIIDYAGLFPPEGLKMGDAVQTYLKHFDGPEAWIVDKFLCPASRLQELAREIDGSGIEDLQVGVIATGGADYDAFQTGLEEDAKTMTWFQEYGEIAGFEVRLPPQSELENVIQDLRAFEAVDVYLELPWGPDQPDQIAAIATHDWLGAKARTGGLDPGDFPSSATLAGFLKVVQDLDVPFKLTAGLHEPLRHRNPKTGAWHHGFLNILTALALNDAHTLSQSEMAEILEAEKLEIDEDQFVFGDWAADGELVRDLFVGFGACSVSEPIDGLRRLGLLEGARR